MRFPRAILAAALPLVLLAGCGVAPEEAFERSFGTPLPAGVKVVHFRGDAFKDPWFVWELRPPDDVFLNTLVKAARLAPPAPGKEVALLGLPWPWWWDDAAIRKLPEKYAAERDSSLYQVWVDRPGRRLFVVFQNN
jgi:hypothetical protein